MSPRGQDRLRSSLAHSVRFESVRPFTACRSCSNGSAPESDIEEIVDIYREVESIGGVTLAATHFNIPKDLEFKGPDAFRQWRLENPAEELQLTLGMLSLEEFDA